MDLFAFYRSDDALEVERAHREVLDVSHGAITRPFFFRGMGEDGVLVPERDGPRCEVVFGPKREHECQCGHLRGVEHAGARCEKCGVEVLASSVRAERWAHVAAGATLLHPVQVPVIAQALGLDEEAVRGVGQLRGWLEEIDGVLRYVEPDPDDEHRLLDHAEATSPAHLRERLRALPPDALRGLTPEELFVDRVPVPPPALRPLERGDGGDLVPGLFDRHLARFVALSSRLGRLFELNAPLIIVLHEHAAVQRAFEALLAVARSSEDRPAGDPETAAAYRPAGPREELVERTYDDFGPKPERVIDLAFTGGSLLVVFPFFSARLSLEGNMMSVHPGVSGPVAGVSADGERVAFPGFTRMGVYDLAHDRWVEGWPDDLDAWAFAEANERGTLIEPESGACWPMNDLGDYPDLVRGTPCGRYAWVADKEGSGGIYRVRDGAIQAMRGHALRYGGTLPVVRADGRVETLSFHDDGGEWAAEVIEQAQAESEELSEALGFVAYGPSAALALSPDRGFVTLAENLVHDRSGVRFAIAFPYVAAAIDREGATLAVADADSISLIDVREPRLIARLDLSPLLEEATFRDRAGIDPELEHRLLAHFGTALRVKAASDAELTREGVDDPGALRDLL